MTKIDSNYTLPLNYPKAAKELNDANTKPAETSHKIKLVVGGIIVSLGLVLAGVHIYPHAIHQWNNFHALTKNNGDSSTDASLNNTVIPQLKTDALQGHTDILQVEHVVPTFSDKFLLKAITLANENPDKDVLIEDVGHHYMRLNNDTGALEAFTKCVAKGGPRAQICQSDIEDLEEEKKTYTKSALNKALGSIKQPLGTASPFLIKLVARAEENRDGDEKDQNAILWSRTGTACADEEKFEQADYWLKLCEDKGDKWAKTCKIARAKIKTS